MEAVSLQDSATDDVVHQQIDVVEYVAKYGRDLFYPICIGDVLVQTYRIEHKLGHGDFSTVWLARNIQEGKDVALKIIIPGHAGEYEYKMQKEILRTVQDTSNLLTYLKTFFLPGQHHNHRVLVFPMRGPSIHYCLEQEQMSLPVATRMSAARQLLKALEQLHNAGIVHQSELTPACRFPYIVCSVHANYSSTDLDDGNVMWDIAPLDKFDTEAKYKLLGRPEKIALSSNLWKPGELVKPLKVPKSLLRETVYLRNFGMAIKAGDEGKHKMLWRTVYCAPERFHNANPSFASDMWSYMCLFTQLYLGLSSPWNCGNSVSLMNTLVKVIGPLPEQWKGHYKASGLCDNSWYDQNRMPDPARSLEARIRRLRPDVSPTERNHVLSIMSNGFSYLPEDRLSAKQLLQDASFKAVMDIYCG
jgi:serine/threonine protein kinase